MNAYPAPPSSAVPGAAPPRRSRPGHWVLLVLGVLLVMAGIGLVVGGAVLLRAEAAQRDGGFVSAAAQRYQSAGHALASPPIVIGTAAEGADGAVGVPDVGDLLSVRVRAASAVPDEDVFLGIAPSDEASAYLEGVPHTVLRPEAWARAGWGRPGGWPGWMPGPGPGWGHGPWTGADPGGTAGDWNAGDWTDGDWRGQGWTGPDGAVPGRTVEGDRQPPEPASQQLWAVSAAGPGEQSLTWVPEPGRWTLVVMNADAGRPVWVDVQAGARSDLAGPVGTGLLWAGLVGLAVGIPLLLLGAAGLGRDIDPDARTARSDGADGADGAVGADPGGRRRGPGAASAADPAPGRAVRELGEAFPLRLTGHLDPPLSRGLWLVKWLLAIPHYVVLAVLWFALVVTTIAAGIAILVTGRYPRAWFGFSVGVLRWSWRVGFYGYSALGTDRYPPFTLAPASYPATLDVPYPARLSRGLVLVKWWLLALPHLLIVGIITGGSGAGWAYYSGDARTAGGFSLLGLLVLIAAVILLFSGRYRGGLFDLVLGLDRWTNRVAAYVLLLRDEYPPFRLDQGPDEPAVPARAEVRPAVQPPGRAGDAYPPRGAAAPGTAPPPDRPGPGPGPEHRGDPR